MCENSETKQIKSQDYSSLQLIIHTFAKSITQSEAEVRSKLIVPIIEWLGYPIEFRAEEFPVYSFEGSQKRPTKYADYILFDDKHFASHNKNTKIDTEWVQGHSLLVFEAKKKNEMPAMLGQPQFYTIWTKAVAYMISDGEKICGCYYNVVTNDYMVLNCSVKDLAANQDIALLSFDNTKSIKSQYSSLQAARISEIKKAIDAIDAQDGVETYITEKNQELIPDELASMMNGFLQGEADGLGKLEVVQKFLSSTDYYLQNNSRYNIPEYMMKIPRRFINASLFLDRAVFPSICGTVAEYYRNEMEEYHFYNDYFDLYITMINGKIVRLFMNYHLKDNSVTVRLSQLACIRSLLFADNIKLVFDNDGASQELPFNNSMFKTDIKQERKRIEFWINEMNKMKCIEDYYQIHFILEPVYDNELITLYFNVDAVYNGIAKQTNCHRIMSGYKERIKIRVNEPILIESADKSGAINMPSLKIHNYNFIPKQIYLPMGIIKTSKRPFIVGFCAVLEPEEINHESS